MDMSMSKPEVIGLVFRLSLVSAITFLSVKWIIKRLDPTNKSKKNAKTIAEKNLKRLARNGTQFSPDMLNEYELMIAAHIIHPEDISVKWSDIAGLDHVIRELKESVILPVQRKDLFRNSKLASPPKGVLLFGPPGCGKTMIAKATAKEAGMSFINLDVSILTDKWYGESQKLAAAVFTLAVKIQPCIVFIDEIDSFLRSRNTNDHEATAMMKAQFMSWWDGLITDSTVSVIIMGATNRPRDLDKAILRRMPATFNIGLPDQIQRERILDLILRTEPKAPNVDVTELAQRTQGFSGSELMELCRAASVYRVRDFITAENLYESPTMSPNEDYFYDALRPIEMQDLLNGVEKIRSSKLLCGLLPMPVSSLDVE